TFRCDAWSPRVSPRSELRSGYTWNRPADCRTFARIATAENGVDDWTIRPLRSPSDQAVAMQCLLARLEKDTVMGGVVSNPILTSLTDGLFRLTSSSLLTLASTGLLSM